MAPTLQSIVYATTLGPEDVKCCRPAGSRESRGDGDGVLASTELTRKGCDGEGLRGLSCGHSYRRRHCRFPGVAAT